MGDTRHYSDFSSPDNLEDYPDRGIAVNDILKLAILVGGRLPDIFWNLELTGSDIKILRFVFGLVVWLYHYGESVDLSGRHPCVPRGYDGSPRLWRDKGRMARECGVSPNTFRTSTRKLAKMGILTSMDKGDDSTDSDNIRRIGFCPTFFNRYVDQVQAKLTPHDPEAILKLLYDEITTKWVRIAYGNPHTIELIYPLSHFFLTNRPKDEKDEESIQTIQIIQTPKTNEAIEPEQTNKLEDEPKMKHELPTQIIEPTKALEPIQSIEEPEEDEQEDKVNNGFWSPLEALAFYAGQEQVERAAGPDHEDYWDSLEPLTFQKRQEQDFEPELTLQAPKLKGEPVQVIKQENEPEQKDEDSDNYWDSLEALTFYERQEQFMEHTEAPEPEQTNKLEDEPKMKHELPTQAIEPTESEQEDEDNYWDSLEASASQERQEQDFEPTEDEEPTEDFEPEDEDSIQSIKTTEYRPIVESDYDTYEDYLLALWNRNQTNFDKPLAKTLEDIMAEKVVEVAESDSDEYVWYYAADILQKRVKQHIEKQAKEQADNQNWEQVKKGLERNKQLQAQLKPIVESDYETHEEYLLALWNQTQTQANRPTAKTLEEIAAEEVVESDYNEQIWYLRADVFQGMVKNYLQKRYFEQEREQAWEQKQEREGCSIERLGRQALLQLKSRIAEIKSKVEDEDPDTYEDYLLAFWNKHRTQVHRPTAKTLEDIVSKPLPRTAYQDYIDYLLAKELRKKVEIHIEKRAEELELEHTCLQKLGNHAVSHQNQTQAKVIEPTQAPKTTGQDKQESEDDGESESEDGSGDSNQPPEVKDAPIHIIRAKEVIEKPPQEVVKLSSSCALPVKRIPIMKRVPIIRRVPIMKRTPIITRTPIIIRTPILSKSIQMVMKAKEILKGMDNVKSLYELKVFKVVEYYEHRCRKAINSTRFRALSNDFRNHKNWKFFVQIYELCKENKWDYRVYIDAQFDRLQFWKHKQPYPYANQFTSEGAQKYYQYYVKDYKEKYSVTGQIKVKPVEKVSSYDEEVIEETTKICNEILGKIEDRKMRKNLPEVSPEDLKVWFIQDKLPWLYPPYAATVPWMEPFLSYYPNVESFVKLRNQILEIQKSPALFERVSELVEGVETKMNMPKHVK